MKQLLLIPILIPTILSADNSYMEKVVFTPESKVGNVHRTFLSPL